MSLYLEYGVTDALALDTRIGYASTSFVQDPVLSPSDSLDGLTDTNLGLRWRLVDEAISRWPTVTLRIAGNIRGDYETGAINTIGDGASGAEFSLIVGKAFENGLSLYAEGGYRVRSKPVPDEQFYNVGASYAFAPRWTGSVNLRFVDALSGIDIGSPGFTPARFPETEEDLSIVDVGLGYQLTESVRVAASYGTVFDGRNTGIQDIASFSRAHSSNLFDTTPIGGTCVARRCIGGACRRSVRADMALVGLLARIATPASLLLYLEIPWSSKKSLSPGTRTGCCPWRSSRPGFARGPGVRGVPLPCWPAPSRPSYRHCSSYP